MRGAARTMTGRKFLEHEGAAGRRMADTDWIRHPLGVPEEWPGSLKAGIATILHAKTPTSLCWGDALYCFYNDALVGLLAQHGQEPPRVGEPACEALTILYAALQRAYENLEASTERVVYAKATFEVSVSPVLTEDGSAAGVSATWQGTTRYVATRSDILSPIHRQVIVTAESSLVVLRGRELIIGETILLPANMLVMADARGKPLLDVLPEFKDQGVVDALQRVIGTSEPWCAYELPLYITDRLSGEQRLRYLNIDAMPFNIFMGETVDIAVLAIDVTRHVMVRDATQKKAKEIHERLQLISKASHDAVWDWDLRSDRLWWSDGFRKLFLYSDREIETGIESWHNRIHPNDKDGVVAGLHKAADSGKKEWTAEYRFKKADGDYAFVADRAHILYDQSGKAYRMVGAMHDITEPRNARMRVAELFEQNRVTSALLESILKNAPVGFALFNDRYEYVHVNPALAELNGLPAEEHIGRTVADILPENWKDVIEVLKHVFNTREPVQTVEVTGNLATRPGVRRSWLVSFYPILTDDVREILYVGAAVLEITKRIDAEEVLRESEKQLRLFTNSMQNLAWMADPRGFIYWYNERWFEYTGTTLDEVQGSGWIKLQHPDHADRVVSFIQEAWRKGDEWELTLPLRRKDGEYRWFLTRVYPIKNDQGQIIRWIGTNTDIHRELEIQNELKKGEDRLRQVSDFMPQIAWSTNADGYHDFYNKRWYEFTGLTFEETKGDQWVKVLHPDDLERAKRVWRQCLATGERYEVEYRMRRHDGEYRWLLARAMPLRSADGTIERWFGTCTDIHDQKTETDKLEVLVQERTRELKRSNEDLQQFAHVASHDLKEPVRKIRTFENMIERRFGAELPAEVNLFLSKIRKSATRMNAMIEGVLRYSSLNGPVIDNQEVDMCLVIDNIKTDLDLLIEEKKATISCRHIPVLRGTPILVYQLFYNLIKNSLKFSHPDRPVRIDIAGERVQHNDRWFHEIVYTDNGIGFNNQYADVIFGSFTRLHAKDQYEGSGLGLALTKKIVERHGGTITAYGVEGVGATFTIRWPAS